MATGRHAFIEIIDLRSHQAQVLQYGKHSNILELDITTGV